LVSCNNWSLDRKHNDKLWMCVVILKNLISKIKFYTGTLNSCL
jgi:hypothetical protein